MNYWTRLKDGYRKIFTMLMLVLLQIAAAAAAAVLVWIGRMRWVCGGNEREARERCSLGAPKLHGIPLLRRVPRWKVRTPLYSSCHRT